MDINLGGRGEKSMAKKSMAKSIGSEKIDLIFSIILHYSWPEISH